MAKREIKIHLLATADLAATRQVNTELAKIAMDVGRKNGDLRQATMLAAREYYNLGDASEKAATRAVLSAKQIEEAWKKAMTKPTDEAARGFGKLKGIAEGAINGIGGSFNDLYRTFDITLKFSAPPRLRERYRLGAGSSRYGNCFF